MQNSYLVVVCCLGVLLRYWDKYTPILMYDDGVRCCLHVMHIHGKNTFLTHGVSTW